MPSSQLIRALAQAAHAVPLVAITGVTAGLVALADLPVGCGILVTGTLFTGTLSISWSNDYLDAERDSAVLRSDKPIATGALKRRTAGIAAVVALGLTVVLSAALGWPGGPVALAAVLGAWAYNLGAKATVLSWLPYAFSFGLLPAAATLSASPPRWPAAWTMTVCALVGVAGHLADVLPDFNEDVATGIRGLPHRIGARTTALTAAAILLAASAVILVGPPGQPGPWQWASFGVTALMSASAALLAYRDPSSRRFFLVILLIAALDLVSFAVAGVRV